MFREKFRYYKRKQPEPDFNDILDFERNSNLYVKRELYIKKHVNYKELGVINPTKWETYVVSSHPGLIVIRNPFTTVGQRYWITKCLSCYARKPNISNLCSNEKLKNINNWWEYCNKNNANSQTVKNALRWVTLGYHHNWNTKVYSEDSKGEFPDELAKLYHLVTHAIFGVEDYSAEAAIINFYHMDSTLSGHADCSEPNKEAPLLSVSFGQTAIFLIGGLTLNEDAISMFLRSGDIVIMAGSSRLRYHGVPRIIKEFAEPWNDFGDETVEREKNECVSDNSGNYDIGKKNNVISPMEENEMISVRNVTDNGGCYYEADFWEPFNEYVESSRININIRQVLLPNQESL